MRTNFRWIKKLAFALFTLFVLLIVVAALFINLSPQFGGKATEAQLEEYAKSENYEAGKFINQGDVNTDMSSGQMLKAIGEMFKKHPNVKPEKPIEVLKVEPNRVAQKSAATRMLWFGHSAFLLQINGQNILLDPMLTEVPAPHPMLGSARFSNGLPIEIDQLPTINAVLISHDHYDHLDYESIKKLKAKTEHFYVPLGLGNHLLRWGVEKEKITELDWWQAAPLGELTFTSTPAQHFSGRGLTDRDKTLWSSWVIQSPEENIYFSGDGGYGEHFKAIGEKFGSFDLALLECGQYNELWSTIHMFPEETAQAGVDVNAKTIMPIHWGAFQLATHTWTDPVERIITKAEELNIEVIAPEIGELVELSKNNKINSNWWTAYE